MHGAAETVSVAVRRPWRAARIDHAAAPTFLLGPARSGTSLLYRALCLHPDTTYISNYVRRLPRLPEAAALNRLPRRLPERQRSAWFSEGSNAYVYGTERTYTQRWLPAPVEGEPVFGACGIPQFPDDAARPHHEQVLRLRRAFARLSFADGRRRIISKRIAHNRRIPLLYAAFPSTRFVSLVRDGRAVAASLSKVDWWLDDRVWWYGGTPRKWAAEGGNPWEICARNWVEELRAIESGLADVPAVQVLSLRYEDFMTAPTETLIRIAAYIGLDGADRAWLARLEHIQFPNQAGDWRHSLAAEDVRTIETWQADLLDVFGYSGSPSPG